MKELHSENYMTMMKEIDNDTDSLKVYHILWETLKEMGISDLLRNL